MPTRAEDSGSDSEGSGAESGEEDVVPKYSRVAPVRFETVHTAPMRFSKTQSRKTHNGTDSVYRGGLGEAPMNNIVATSGG